MNCKITRALVAIIGLWLVQVDCELKVEVGADGSLSESFTAKETVS